MSIQISELHIKERTIEIRNAKGHKERIISISEDMAFLLENYCRFIKSMVSVQDKWLFPNRSIQHSIFLLVHLEIDLIGFGIPGFYPSERFDFCACTAGGEDTMTSLLSEKTLHFQ